MPSEFWAPGGYFLGTDMLEKRLLRLFVGFLLLISVASLASVARAAASATPIVAGYSAGHYRAQAGAFTTAANASEYGTNGIINVGGKAITIPAKLRLAANASQYTKGVLSITPWGLLGTAALGYLTHHNFFVGPQGQTMISVSGQYFWIVPGQTSGAQHGSGVGACTLACNQDQGSFISYTPSSGTNNPEREGCHCQGGAVWNNNPFTRAVYRYNAPNENRPAVPSDFENLPDPLPDLAHELPYAPYMPNGAPVDAPFYDFAPMDVPLGQPYTRPDGSTAQPRAKISPNDNTVTVAPYDQPLTDPQGNPTPNATPEPTPDPPKDPCDEHPDRAGCANLGSDDYAIPKTSINFAFTPEASPINGTCPAPVAVLGNTLSFQPACDAMSMIRPLVIGMASILAAYILIGAFREV